MQPRARLTRRYRGLTITACALLGAVVHLSVGVRSLVDGYWLDAAVTLRGALHTGSGVDPSAPVVVVVLDQRSLDSERLQELPRALMHGQWAALITYLTAAGARSVAFDFLFEYSPEKLFAGWDEAVRPEWDRDFKRALYRNRSKVVLGREGPVVPHRAYTGLLPSKPAGATGQMELLPDVDGIIRRVHLRLARRATAGAAQAAATDALSLSGAALSRAGLSAFPDSVLLAIDTVP